jgi:hypothetical protein
MMPACLLELSPVCFVFVKSYAFYFKPAYPFDAVQPLKGGSGLLHFSAPFLDGVNIMWAKIDKVMKYTEFCGEKKADVATLL